MRTLTYFVASSIDGFIASPDGAPDFLMGDHVPWVAAEYPEGVPGHVRGPLGVEFANRRFDTVVMGRGTYEPGVHVGVTSPYPHLRQYVVSRTMTTSPDPAVELVTTDPLEKVRALKQEDGLGIWFAGGGKLASTLLPEIDELVVKLIPVVAGSGVPLFATDKFQNVRFTLVSSHVHTTGAAIMHYARQ